MELLDPQLLLLRDFELRLLRCTLPCDSSSQDTGLLDINAITASDYHPLLKVIADVISLLESGLYTEALSSEAALLLFKLNPDELYDDSVDSADKIYSQLMTGVDSFFDQSSDTTDGSYKALLVMSIAIAAFLAFTQSNLTGPSVSFPDCPLPFQVSKGAEWENWARNQVMLSGSDLLGKFSNLQYIVFSKMLLMRAKDLLSAGPIASFGGIKTVSWWLARAIFIQQRILDERSSSLFELLQVFLKETLNHFGTVKEVTGYWGPNLHEEEAETIVTMLHLEAGVVEQTYGRVDSCWRHFQLAEVSSGLHLSVTGALGVRTVHQVEPKAQLVLVTNTDKSNGVDRLSGVSVIQNDASSNDNECLPPCEPAMSETSDILMTPKLLQKFEDHGIRGEHPGNRDNATALNASQQAVILAQCLLIEKSNRLDEMQRWEMAPYIEAIDSQKSSLFIIRCFCDILRIRWESTRSRTKERALMMMERVVQSVYDPSPGVTQRIRLCYGTLIPPTPVLRKEYGNLLVGYGLIGEAVKTFEDLELWDNLIHCYRLLEKKAAAVELINTRLNQKPLDPRLWCSLGDITINDFCYEKALEVSNNRSARAKRSLARSAYNRGEYENSKNLWESAMAMNSLYPDGWFAFGAAALKARDVDKAVDGFTRAVQLDPENGEAWNNIACLHMIKKKNKEASIAFKEALKFKRNSWQLWENYGQVSLDVGNLSQALEAVQMVLDLTNKKRIDVTSLETIMIEMEKRLSVNQSERINDSGDTIDSVSGLTPPDQGIQSLRENDNLLASLGKTLQMIVRSGSPEAAIWGLYAKWHKIKGDLTMCSEALLKQVRSYQGSDMWKDIDRFKKFACASLELCKVYMEIASSTHNRRELVAAEMHLKNIIKQGGSFSDVKEFLDLQACLTEVKNLQSSVLSSS